MVRPEAPKAKTSTNFVEPTTDTTMTHACPWRSTQPDDVDVNNIRRAVGSGRLFKQF
jgi:hypothetical protein